MKTFPTMNDVNNLIKEQEVEKRKNYLPKVMQFNINSYLSENERIKRVAADIAIEYPEIPDWLRDNIAIMEEPIKGCHEDYDMFYTDELRIFRLFNILQKAYDKKLNDIYNKAYADIKRSYKMFLEHFTYANPGEQKVSMIMRTIKEFTKDTEIEIPEY